MREVLSLQRSQGGARRQDDVQRVAMKDLPSGAPKVPPPAAQALKGGAAVVLQAPPSEPSRTHCR